MAHACARQNLIYPADAHMLEIKIEHFDRVDNKKLKFLKSIFSLSWDDYLTNSGLGRP